MIRNFMFGSLLCVLLIAPAASAATRPFLFTFTSPNNPDQNAVIHFDAGWGDGSLGFSEDPFFDQRLGGLARLGSRWVLSGNVGFGKDEDSNWIFGGQMQAFYDFRQSSQPGFHYGAGGGIRWERDGTNVALATFASGWQAKNWRFENNVVLEKANAPDRDPIDLIISTGWLHRVTDFVSLGLEAVGQDLEGFWEPNEAEGGARIFIGPTIHFGAENWEGGVSGGYVFRPTISSRTSVADRPFGSNRLLLQISIGRNF